MTPGGLRQWELARLERSHLDGPFTRDASLRIDTAVLRLEAATQEAVARDVRNLFAELEARELVA